LPRVDELIAIVAAGDSDALANRAHPQDVLCSRLPGNMCADSGSEPEDLVSVLPGAICDDNPFLAADVDRFASSFLERVASSEVYAAWDALPSSDGPTNSVPEGSVRVLWDSGASLIVSDDGDIWYTHFGCGAVNEVIGFLPENTEYRIRPPDTE
jgi:hypothetical protein